MEKERIRTTQSHLKLQGFLKGDDAEDTSALCTIMTLGSPFLHSVPWHNRPAHSQWGDSSLPGHQPGQPGLSPYPAAGWSRAWHLQQGQRNAALQRWVAAFLGMLRSSDTIKAELQDFLWCGSEIQSLAPIFCLPPVVLSLLCLTCHATASLLIHIRDRISGCPARRRLQCGVEGVMINRALSTGCLHNIPNLWKAG